MRMVEDRGASGSVAGLLGTSAEHDLVIASFSRFLGARGCSPNTVSAYLHDLRFLFAFLLSAGLTLEQLNVARSIDFMAYLAARPRRVGGRHASTPAIVSDRLAPATINRVMAAVSTFYEHLVLTRALSFERNPLDGGGNEQRSTRRTNRRSMRLRRVLRVPRPMDNEQVSRLLGAATRLRDRTMLLLLLQGGIRVGELLNLHLEDVQYGRRRIAIRYRVDHPRGVRTKSRCERLVDLLEPEALASLSNYVATERPHDAPTQHVFLVGGCGRRRCEALGYDAFVKLFRRLRRKAGLDEGWITPHALRHTHATLLWEGIHRLASYVRAQRLKTVRYRAIPALWYGHQRLNLQRLALEGMPYPCPRCAYGLPRLPMPVAAPKVGAPCSICTHPARAAIEGEVRSGTTPLRAIGRAHGVSHWALIRHRDTHRQLAPARHLHPPKWLTPEHAAKAGARCEKCGGTSFWTNPLEGTGGCTVCWPAQFDHGRKSFFET